VELQVKILNEIYGGERKVLGIFPKADKRINKKKELLKK